MILKSFFSKDGKLHPMEVEVRLMPGIPNLQVLGLPDAALKESALRIKSALTSQGFKWPKGRQVVVNLRPTHVRKHSRGLDLAIAAAMLWETDQIPTDEDLNLKELFVYGEVGLHGEVLPPVDLESVRPLLKESSVLLTSRAGVLKHEGRVGVERLLDLAEEWGSLRVRSSENSSGEIRAAAPLKEISFSEEHANLLALSALTGVPTLLAGPPGSGKTTFGECLHALMPAMIEDEFLDLRAHHLQLGENLSARPFVNPHHSTPLMSLIGGGSSPFPGEIAKAHGGLLMLDEFLLFPSRVIEALREPLESKVFRVARKGHSVNWPADFQFVATTNLCPCGRLSADKKFHCQYTLHRCKSVWTKLSGPMLDRFDLVVLFKAYEGRLEEGLTVSIKEIQGRVEAARKLMAENPIELEDMEVPEIYRFFQSRRRERALKRLARGLAALDAQKAVRMGHWTEAFMLSQRPVEDLQKLFS